MQYLQTFKNIGVDQQIGIKHRKMLTANIDMKLALIEAQVPCCVHFVKSRNYIDTLQRNYETKNNFYSLKTTHVY